MNHFYIVVGKPDCGEGARGDDGDPYEGIAQVRPQQSGDHDRNCNQQASHGGGASFFLMGLGTFFADKLTNLKFPQAVDDKRANDQASEKGGETGERSPERKIAEDAEGREVMEQLDEQQPVKQRASRTDRWSLTGGRLAKTTDPPTQLSFAHLRWLSTTARYRRQSSATTVAQNHCNCSSPT